MEKLILVAPLDNIESEQLVSMYNEKSNKGQNYRFQETITALIYFDFSTMKFVHKYFSNKKKLLMLRSLCPCK